MLEENNPQTDATRMMSIPRMYVLGTLLYLRCMCMSASKLVTTSAETSVSRMTNQHGHWVYWMSMGGKSSFKHTASSSVEHVVEVTAKRRLFLVTSVTSIFQTKSSTV